MISKKFLWSAFLTLLLVACSNEGEVNSDPISVGGPPNLTALNHTAEDAGLFEQGDIEVEYRVVQTAKLTLDAVLSRDIDIGFTVDANVAGAVSAGGDDFWVIAIGQRKFDDGVVVNSEAFLEGESSLEGLSIGYIPGTTSHVFLHRYLEANGYTFEDVDLVTSTPAGLQAAMIAGEIDAASVWQPFRSNVLAEGDGFFEINNEGHYDGVVYIVTHRDFYEENADSIRAYLRVLADAAEVAADNPALAIAASAERMGMPEAVLGSFWDRYELVLADPAESADAIIAAYSALEPDADIDAAALRARVQSVLRSDVVGGDQ